MNRFRSSAEQPFPSSDVGLITVALCLLVTAFMSVSSPTLPPKPVLVKETTCPAVPVPPPSPAPPDEAALKEALVSQQESRREHLQELLQSLSFPRQIVLPALVGTEGYQFSHGKREVGSQGGISHWWKGKTGQPHADQLTDLREEKSSPDLGQTVSLGLMPTRQLLEAQSVLRWDDRHVVADRATFNWDLVYGWNRYFLFARGGMRILSSSWNEEDGHVVPRPGHAHDKTPTLY